MNKIGRYIPDEIPKDFWQIIDACNGDKQNFKSAAENLSEDDLLRFCWNYQEAIGQIATLYSEMTSFSEDSIEDLCSWVVSKGEKIYTKIWDNAEDIITNEQSPYGKIQKDPGLLGEALKHYKHLYKKEVPAKKNDRFV